MALQNKRWNTLIKVSGVLILLVLAFIVFSIVSFPCASSACEVLPACIGAEGYMCSSPTLSNQGNLTFIFTQNTGSMLYNVGMGCVEAGSGATSNLSGTIVYLSKSGSATSITANGPAIGALTLSNNQTITVSGLKCWSLQGKGLNNVPINTSLIGVLFLNYTKNSGAPTIVSNGTNPILTTKFAIFKTKVQ